LSGRAPAREAPFPTRPCLHRAGRRSILPGMSDEEEPDPEKRKGIPLRWVFYTILAYAFFQTLYLWWQTRGL